MAMTSAVSGGNAAARPEIFLQTVFHDLPQGARPWVAGFRADPYHPKAHWGGSAVNGRIPEFIEPEANCYLAVSSFGPGNDGRIYRRKENFAALHLVMVDDVGTKVPLAAITLDPSYLLETSPGNHQAGYLLSEPVTDRALAESVIDALVAQGLMTGGKDPGMKGVTRYGRLPVGINNKPALVAEHGQPFKVQMREWEPERRYTLAEIIEAYGLKLGKTRAEGDHAPYESYEPQADDPLLNWLAQRGLLQGPAKDSGWIPISCPWIDEHTDRADTGAAYLPGRGFQCHHGHCESRTILDLRSWAKRQGWKEAARPAQGEGAEANEELQDENLFSDYGNVVKLRNRLADRLAYTPGLDWLIYNSVTGIWEPEPCSERVKRLALETLREAWSSVLYAAQRDEADLKKELKALDGDDPRAAMVQKKVKLATVHRDKVFQWVRQCETAYRIRSTLEIAEGYFWTAPAIWDANPHILVCANGVLDLATGTLLPHSPGHHATKTTGTAFKPGAQHPAWEAVTALLKAEGDRYTFIHQYCGSGLHGANPNERLVIAQGDGGTGKGTLLTAIHQALGAYAETIEVGSLLATDWRRQNKSAPREDLLKLRGARFVSPGIEPPKDSKLDDGSIKALTGNDAISARAPHAKNSITFTPVFKLIVQTNFPLRTEFDDPGMKRRVIVVPFNQKPDRPDPAVKDALIHDPEARAACLAWLYEGYRAWRNAGYALPESALATSATAEYWDDMNPFAQFARDVGLKFGKLERCPKPKLTGALKAWREETGRFDASLKGFPGWLKSKGCFDQQITGGSRFWYGVGFAEASSQQSQESPPDSANTAVDFQYSKSTDKFTNTASDSGYDCYGGSDDPTAPPPRPADDGLSSQHRPVDPPKPDRNAPLPATATADAGELWNVLKLYRGWETFSQLAKKLGWPQSRVIAAAQELQEFGRAEVKSGGWIRPVGEAHP